MCKSAVNDCSAIINRVDSAFLPDLHSNHDTDQPHRPTRDAP